MKNPIAFPTSTKSLILAVAISCTALVGCGKNNSHSNSQVATFTGQNENGEQREFEIEMQAAQFGGDASTSNQNATPTPIKRNTVLGQQITGVKVEYDTVSSENKTVTIKLQNKKLQNKNLIFEVISGERQYNDFQAIDTTGAYTLAGRCAGALCETARLALQKKGEAESTEIKYARTVEYMQAEDISKFRVSHESDVLLREAIEYGFPIARHSSRIDEFRDLDVLVIERLQVDDTDARQMMELEASGKRIRATDFTKDLPRNTAKNDKPTSAVSAPTATGKSFDDFIKNSSPADATSGAQNGRVSGSTTLKTPSVVLQPIPQNSNTTQQQTVTKPSPAAAKAPVKATDKPQASPSNSAASERRTETPAQPSVSPIVNVGSRLTLTRNPFVAYNVEMPEQLFRRGTVVKSISNFKNMDFNIVPVSQQDDFEPSFRIGTIANAMVEQRVRIYRNACNIFVRAAMALAGYLEAPWFRANSFDLTFKSTSDGLNRWESAEIVNLSTSNRDFNATKMENRLRYLLEQHSVILQVKRNTNIGHVGIVTKENGKYYFYDGNLDDTKRGLLKREVKLENLIRSYPGVLRIHALPNLLKPHGNSRQA